MAVEFPINVYGLTRQYERVKIADAVITAEAVGGTIFHIDDTADGEYQFFDANGNVIENVSEGDAPYAYKVITPGIKDKYYVYHDEVYDNLRWTYYKDGDYADEALGLSDTAVGAGKPNTKIVMTANNGVYITADSNGYPTIWYQLQQVRNAKVGGCDDWFIPSLEEAENLRLTIKSGAIAGGTIAGSSYDMSVFANSYLWSSTKFPAGLGILAWNSKEQNWFQCGVTAVHSVFFIRAF